MKELEKLIKLILEFMSSYNSLESSWNFDYQTKVSNIYLKGVESEAIKLINDNSVFMEFEAEGFWESKSKIYLISEDETYKSHEIADIIIHLVISNRKIRLLPQKKISCHSKDFFEGKFQLIKINELIVGEIEWNKTKGLYSLNPSSMKVPIDFHQTLAKFPYLFLRIYQDSYKSL